MGARVQGRTGCSLGPVSCRGLTSLPRPRHPCASRLSQFCASCTPHPPLSAPPLSWLPLLAGSPFSSLVWPLTPKELIKTPVLWKRVSLGIRKTGLRPWLWAVSLQLVNPRLGLSFLT